MRILFVPLAAAGFAFGLITALTEVVGSEPPQAARPTSIIWADRVFAERRDLAKWLKARGTTYSAWSARHPHAAGLLEGREPPTLARATEPDPSSRRSAAPASASVEAGHPMMGIGLLFASVLGLLTLAAAVRRTPRLRTVGGRRTIALARFRGALSGFRATLPRRAPQRVVAPDALSRSRVALSLRHKWAELGPRAVERTRRLAASVLAAARSHAAKRPMSLRREWAELGQRVERTRRVAASVLAAARSHAAKRPMSLRPPMQGSAMETLYALRRRMLLRVMPDFAWYASSVLLALVVGASVALYLN